MTHLVVIEEEAEREFVEAVRFYEEREPGLGQRFARDVLLGFKNAAENPEQFALVGRLTRKVKILGWPYSFYFTIRKEAVQIVVSTVWHGSRNPAELQRRIR